MTQAVSNEPAQTKAEFIFQLPIFSGIQRLGSGAARDFLKICKEYKFKAHSIVAYDGDVADSMYLVREGQLESLAVEYVDQEQIFSRDRIYTTGDWFHDIWLFEPERHPTLIRSRKEGRVILIKNQDFMNFVKKHPASLRSIYPHLDGDAQDAIHRSRFHGILETGTDGRVVGSKTQPATEQESRRSAVIPEDPISGAPPSEEAMAFQPTKEQLKRYASLGLAPDEFVEFDARRSTKIMVFRAVLLAVIAVVLFAVSTALLIFSLEGLASMAITIGLAIGALPLIQLFLYWVNWRNCFFVITNKRLIRYEFLVFQFRTNIEKIDVEKVQSVNIQKPNFISTTLQVGTAAITTAAQSSVLYFDYIDNPQKVEVVINKINERRKFLQSSRVRSTLRKSIDRHFGARSILDEIKTPLPPPPPKTFMHRMRERFVRQEIGDSVIYHKHPVALVRMVLLPSIMALILLVVGYVGVFFFWTVFIIPAVIGVFIVLVIANLAWFLWQVEDWRNDTFEVTDRYIYDIDRLPLGFGESRKQAELSRVENVRTIQDGFLPTLFNFGSVQVETAGADSHIVFENVREPSQIQNEIFAKRDTFLRKQKKKEEDSQLDRNTLLIELYDEAREHARIKRYRPLPPVLDEDEEYDAELDYAFDDLFDDDDDDELLQL